MLADTRANDLSGPPLCLVAINGYGLGLGDKAHNGRDNELVPIDGGTVPASNPKRPTPDSWGARLEVEAGDLALEQLQGGGGQMLLAVCLGSIEGYQFRLAVYPPMATYCDCSPINNLAIGRHPFSVGKYAACFAHALIVIVGSVSKLVSQLSKVPVVTFHNHKQLP
ncbi:hypothetical protein BDQ94DRAFT_164534 [Aspergillus welwitschiae]|uniref:Uncharacterized protein n=1 Tax=Aspergillus welwitschiae TaxID=1341132 RepID=A0A3F3PHF3_9EURO|nr:hypothetical protein BDQ94DRAFT_164534 [Aspergillus welwitschiae]RDH26371.1 hypothetical protein BDQ94DRAFT_164534 [Aspergillus welwitschiae]